MTAETVTCPWCSASVPSAAATCPSCGAALRDSGTGDVAGVTQLDPAAVASKRGKPRGIAAWLTGDRDDESPSVGKVEPPSDAVRQEMRRLELAAIEAELAARAAAAAANRELGIDADGPAPDGAQPSDAAHPSEAAQSSDGAPDQDQPA